MKTITEAFRAARTVSVPLVAIRTPDQQALVERLVEQNNNKHPMFSWDAVRGIVPLNDMAANAKIDLNATSDFVNALIAAQSLPKFSCMFMFNANRQLHSQEPQATAAAVQALSNLRPTFKTSYRMAVLLGVAFTAPPELDREVIIYDDQLPTPEELRTMIVELYDNANDERAKLKPPLPAIAKPKESLMAKMVEALLGLSMFAAEQVTALSFGEAGVDLDDLWERKRVAIEQVAGLTVYRGGDRFDDLRGLDSVKSRLKAHENSKTPVGVVAWIDEGSDVFSNADSESSGTKMDQQRGLLVEMEQNGWRGIIAVGVPGSGKSAIARAMGNEVGVPTISIDFGAMTNKYVGESEANLRNALNVIKAVGNGNAFFVLTCNSLKGIRPQFQRRFKRGIFFFDLPTPDEQKAIWDFHMKRLSVKKQTMPDYAGWTGAEIRECVESAWDLNQTLIEAATYIVPVSQSRAPEIDQMRREANGRFLDASDSGPFKYDKQRMEKQLRAMNIGGDMGTTH